MKISFFNNKSLAFYFIISVFVFPFIISCSEKNDSKFSKSEQKWIDEYNNLADEKKKLATEIESLLKNRLSQKNTSNKLMKKVIREAYERDMNVDLLPSLEKMLIKEPGNISLQCLKANILFEEGFSLESKKYFEKLLKKQPGNQRLLAGYLRTLINELPNKEIKTLVNQYLKVDPKKSASFLLIKGLIYWEIENLEEAYNCLAQAADIANSSLSSKIYRDLSKISRQLGYPLLDRYYYSLYRPYASPEGMKLLYSHVDGLEKYELISSEISVGIFNSQNLEYNHSIEVHFNKKTDELVLPIPLPPGKITDFKISISQNYTYSISETNFTYTKIQTFKFQRDIEKGKNILIEVKYKDDTHMNPEQPWVWQSYRLIYPSKLTLTSGPGFGIDSAAIESENKKEGLELTIQQTGSTYKVQLKEPTLVAIPSFSFSQGKGIQWIANKNISISFFYIIISFIIALLYRFKARKSIRWGLFILTAIYGFILLISKLPSSFLPDLPSIILKDLCSPTQNFPQDFLTLLFFIITIIIVFFTVWLSSWLKEYFLVEGERLIVVFAPIVFPILLSAATTYHSFNLLKNEIGWISSTYISACLTLFLVLSFIVVLQQVRESLLVHLISFLIGIFLSWIGSQSSILKIITDIVFISLAILWFFSLWLSYQKQYEKLPVEISEETSMLVKLNSHVGTFYNKYDSLFKTALYVSGIAAFITSIITLLEKAH